MGMAIKTSVCIIIVCGDFKISEMSSAAQYLLWDDCSLMDKVRGGFSGKSYLPCSIQLILAGIDVLGRCTFANARRVTFTYGVSNLRPRVINLYDLFRLSRSFFRQMPPCTSEAR
jgi:hypothetical protein